MEKKRTDHQFRSMEDNLYLVTVEGERHEDHIPLGFYDYHHLQEKFPFKHTKELHIDDGDWWTLAVLDTMNFDFTEEEKSKFRKGTWKPQDSQEVTALTVILVQKNKEIDQT